MDVLDGRLSFWLETILIQTPRIKKKVVVCQTLEGKHEVLSEVLQEHQLESCLFSSRIKRAIKERQCVG